MAKSTNSQKSNSISKFVIYTFMILMIVTGSINTIANKMQNISTSLEINYKHDWFITFCMFLGESLCYFMYLIQEKLKQKNPTDENQTGALIQDETQDSRKLIAASPFQLMLPALCDFFGSTLMTIGLSMIAGSIYQMLRGSLILFTAVFSVIFLKNKLYRHNFLGIFFVILGLVIVGIAAFASTTVEGCKVPDDESNNVLVGFIIVICAQIFTATQFILEENFMKKYDCPPLKAVGWEGIWGSILYIIVLIIFQFIKCTPPEAGKTNLSSVICFKNDEGVYLLEDTLFALRQLGNNGALLFYTILYTCSIGVFNFVGITISKVLSAPARAVLDTIRTVVVWAFFILPIVDKCKREQFKILQLIGFVFLILGTLIYNEIFVIPILGLDQHYKTNKQTENKTESVDF